MEVGGLEGRKGTPKKGEPVPKEQGNSTGGDPKEVTQLLVSARCCGTE